MGEVTKLVGVQAHVLRYWEKEIPAIRPSHAGANQRRYRRRDVELFREVRRLLYEEKFTLANARKHLSGPATAPATHDSDSFKHNFDADPALSELTATIAEHDMYSPDLLQEMQETITKTLSDLTTSIAEHDTTGSDLLQELHDAITKTSTARPMAPPFTPGPAQGIIPPPRQVMVPLVAPAAQAADPEDPSRAESAEPEIAAPEMAAAATTDPEAEDAEDFSQATATVAETSEPREAEMAAEASADPSDTAFDPEDMSDPEDVAHAFQGADDGFEDGQGDDDTLSLEAGAEADDLSSADATDEADEADADAVDPYETEIAAEIEAGFTADMAAGEDGPADLAADMQIDAASEADAVAEMGMDAASEADAVAEMGMDTASEADAVAEMDGAEMEAETTQAPQTTYVLYREDEDAAGGPDIAYSAADTTLAADVAYASGDTPDGPDIAYVSGETGDTPDVSYGVAPPDPFDVAHASGHADAAFNTFETQDDDSQTIDLPVMPAQDVPVPDVSYASGLYETPEVASDALTLAEFSSMYSLPIAVLAAANESGGAGASGANDAWGAQMPLGAGMYNAATLAAQLPAACYGAADLDGSDAPVLQASATAGDSDTGGSNARAWSNMDDIEVAGAEATRNDALDDMPDSPYAAFLSSNGDFDFSAPSFPEALDDFDADASAYASLTRASVPAANDVPAAAANGDAIEDPAVSAARDALDAIGTNAAGYAMPPNGRSGAAASFAESEEPAGGFYAYVEPPAAPDPLPAAPQDAATEQPELPGITAAAREPSTPAEAYADPWTPSAPPAWDAQAYNGIPPTPVTPHTPVMPIASPAYVTPPATPIAAAPIAPAAPFVPEGAPLAPQPTPTAFDAVPPAMTAAPATPTEAPGPFGQITPAIHAPLSPEAAAALPILPPPLPIAPPPLPAPASPTVAAVAPVSPAIAQQPEQQQPPAPIVPAVQTLRTTPLPLPPPRPAPPLPPLPSLAELSAEALTAPHEPIASSAPMAAVQAEPEPEVEVASEGSSRSESETLVVPPTMAPSMGAAVPKVVLNAIRAVSASRGAAFAEALRNLASVCGVPQTESIASTDASAAEPPPEAAVAVGSTDAGDRAGAFDPLASATYGADFAAPSPAATAPAALPETATAVEATPVVETAAAAAVDAPVDAPADAPADAPVASAEASQSASAPEVTSAQPSAKDAETAATPVAVDAAAAAAVAAASEASAGEAPETAETPEAAAAAQKPVSEDASPTQPATPEKPATPVKPVVFEHPPYYETPAHDTLAIQLLRQKLRSGLQELLRMASE